MVIVSSVGSHGAGAADPASASYASVLPAPPATPPVRVLSPARAAWLVERCAQLVAFFDYYGVSRGENSDGPRNHTRIGAAIDCQKGDVLAGKRTIEALIVRKAFVAPTPTKPEVEPEDIEAPDITLPTRAER
jgi:hypothetical protein